MHAIILVATEVGSTVSQICYFFPTQFPTCRNYVPILSYSCPTAITAYAYQNFKWRVPIGFGFWECKWMHVTCNYIRACLTHDNYFSFGNKMFNLKVRNGKPFVMASCPNFLYLVPLLWWLFPTIYGTYQMEDSTTCCRYLSHAFVTCHYCLSLKFTS